MKLVPLNTIFDIQYGNQFDLMKMSLAETREEGINFISRASKNFGIAARVLNYDFTKPYPPGLITVTLGGSYLLASFIQPEKFYTAQNIKVLSPKNEMTFNEKLFYCLCIQKNRFRYSSHGREANVSLDSILVPDHVPKQIEKYSIENIVEHLSKQISKSNVKLNIAKWTFFECQEIFDVIYGVNLELNKMNIVEKGIPFVSRTSANNGVSAYVERIESIDPNPANTISVSGGGSVMECFFQGQEYYSGRDLYYLSPKFNANKYHLLFISTILKLEKYRFNFGRQANKTLKKMRLKLPSNDGQLDLEFMENFIKSLPYSASI